MRYKGTIEEINKIIVPDPSYDKQVTCRYEKDNIQGNNWKVDILINDIKEKYEDIEVKGKDLFIILQASNENCKLNEDGTFTYNAYNKINGFEIGMDTACVAMGINSHANLIEHLQKTGYWQPDCSFKTLTDGLFGMVKEGVAGNLTNFIYINGYLDEDTEYSNEDIINILSTQLEIKDIQKIEGKTAENIEEMEEEL